MVDPAAKAKAGTPCITLAYIKPEVLINTLANRLEQVGV